MSEPKAEAPMTREEFAAEALIHKNGCSCHHCRRCMMLFDSIAAAARREAEDKLKFQEDQTLYYMKHSESMRGEAYIERGLRWEAEHSRQALAEALRKLMTWADTYVPGGCRKCGQPDASCDSDCVTAAAYSEARQEFSSALATHGHDQP